MKATKDTIMTTATAPRAAAGAGGASWRLTLTAAPGWAGTDLQRLRRALKVLGRCFGLRCVKVEGVEVGGVEGGAERKMGEMLAQTERAKGARDKKKAESRVVTPPTLKEIGLTKNESAKAQALPKIILDTT